METNAISRACALAGSQSALARLIGVSPQSIQKWCRTGSVPPKRVIEIEKAVNQQVTRYELRPDIYQRDDAA